IGSEKASLLLPLYAVVAMLALSLAWQLLRGDSRTRELGPVAWPLAAVVLWTGLSLAWTLDPKKGAIFLAAFILPFGLLAIGFAFSYSQSSFIALAVGVVVSAAVAWGRRAVVALVALGLLAAVVALAAPQVRHEITGKSGRGLNKITSGRSNLVSQGIHIAVD